MLSFSRFSSRLAQNSLNFALLLLIVDETGKAFYSSLLVLALVVPSTVAGIAAGTAADALPRRLLVFGGDIARAIICVLFVLGPGSTASFYAVAIGLSAFGQFANAAESVIMPAVVDRADLADANAISHAIGGAAQVAGFGVLTPVVLRLFDSADALFLIGAALFVVAGVQAILIGRARPAVPEEVVGDPSEGTWWKVGWRQMQSDPLVMHAAVELTLISAALIILGGLIPKYIDDVLGLPVDVGVLVLLPGALGVALGLRVAGVLAHRVSHAALSTAGFIAFVLLLGAFSFVNELAGFLGGYGVFGWLNDVSIGRFDGGGVVAMAIVFPLGFSYALVAVAAQTVINDRVPLRLQGRVIATQGALTAIASSLPVLVAGAMSDLAGVTPVMALVAATTGLAAFANMRRPRLSHTRATA
ncbi:MAG: MFS transporter [Tepidiformaceae bacterium]